MGVINQGPRSKSEVLRVRVNLSDDQSKSYRMIWIVYFNMFPPREPCCEWLNGMEEFEIPSLADIQNLATRTSVDDHMFNRIHDINVAMSELTTDPDKMPLGTHR
jgi:hypothetical protein